MVKLENSCWIEIKYLAIDTILCRAHSHQKKQSRKNIIMAIFNTIPISESKEPKYRTATIINTEMGNIFMIFSQILTSLLSRRSISNNSRSAFCFAEGIIFHRYSRKVSRYLVFRSSRRPSQRNQYLAVQNSTQYLPCSNLLFLEPTHRR